MCVEAVARFILAFSINASTSRFDDTGKCLRFGIITPSALESRTCNVAFADAGSSLSKSIACSLLSNDTKLEMR